MQSSRLRTGMFAPLCPMCLIPNKINNCEMPLEDLRLNEGDKECDVETWSRSSGRSNEKPGTLFLLSTLLCVEVSVSGEAAILCRREVCSSGPCAKLLAENDRRECSTVLEKVFRNDSLTT
mmetsp:Transcript_23080/g.36111  ORF Transcript_23080/g.36111 Transcript_23080/m.36111 type:complete len:121 (-) Transcript_23080:171-533(-)